MIHSFPELVVVLDIYLSKYTKIQSAIDTAQWRLDFVRVAELRVQSQVLQKKISKLLAYYKSKINQNYLELRLYGDCFQRLEHYFQNVFLGLEV